MKFTALFLSTLLFATFTYANFEEGFIFYNNKNYEKALNLWQSACEKNDARACNVLALMYDNGEYVKENKNRAKEFYKKACDTGDDVGCKFYKKMVNLGY